MTYKEKAKILSKNFFIAGVGCFDLSLEEVAYIIELLETKKHKDYLDINLQELYDRLSKQRLG